MRTDANTQRLLDVLADLEGCRTIEDCLLWRAIAAGVVEGVLGSERGGVALADRIRSVPFWTNMDDVPRRPDPDDFEWDWSEYSGPFEEDLFVKGADNVYLPNEACIAHGISAGRSKATALVYRAVSALHRGPSTPPPADQPIDLSFLAEEERKLLLPRWHEAFYCRQSDLDLAGVIMLGSFIEGVLFFSLRNRLSEEHLAKYGKARDRRTGEWIVLEFDRWTLDPLLAAANELVPMRGEFKSLLRLAQELRNHVHIGKAAASGEQVSRILFDAVWVAARKLTSDLKDYCKEAVPSGG